MVNSGYSDPYREMVAGIVRETIARFTQTTVRNMLTTVVANKTSSQSF